MYYEPHYLPFVGSSYDQGINGKKVMVLGYSIYGDKPQDTESAAVQNRVNWYLDDTNVEFEPWMNTYTHFIRALSGEEISRGDSSIWWNKILFYSYVQEPLDGVRQAPTDEQLRSAVQPFLTVLQQYLPDVVLVWGKELYEVTPTFDGHKGEPIDGNETWVYNIGGKEIRMLEMTHPSAGYSWSYWHEIIYKLL